MVATRIRPGVGAIAAALLALIGCQREATTGPVEITWDRDTCAHCAMVIGDRRFAAEVRHPQTREPEVFDDLGCALLWLADVEARLDPGEGRAPAEIWVRDPAGETWVDARATRFGSGYKTPMGFGFAAVADAPPGSFDLEEVRRRVAAREDERRHHDR